MTHTPAGATGCFACQIGFDRVPVACEDNGGANAGGRHVTRS